MLLLVLGCSRWKRAGDCVPRGRPRGYRRRRRRTNHPCGREGM
jgi:hypothetical protein